MRGQCGLQMHGGTGGGVGVVTWKNDSRTIGPTDVSNGYIDLTTGTPQAGSESVYVNGVFWPPACYTLVANRVTWTGRAPRIGYSVHVKHT